MRLAIMQPYFFPNAGHFALIARSDRWIVFDITQYTPKSWMTRNRVLRRDGGWAYIQLPVRNASRSQRIREVMVGDLTAASQQVLGAISHYRKRAPFFAVVEDIVRDTFARTAETMVEVNVRSLKLTCSYLDIPFHYEICSEMQLDLPDRTSPGGWAPRIAAAVGADEYVNPIGGRELFNPAGFASRGVTLSFLETPDFVYATGPFAYEPGLSILDVMMWNEPSAIRAFFESARIVPAISS